MFLLKKIFHEQKVFMSKMWILLTYKNCSNESENTPDCIDFGLFFQNFPGGGRGGCPRTPLDCTSAMQMRMSRRLCRRSTDSSTRKNFPLFSQQSVTGYAWYGDRHLIKLHFYCSVSDFDHPRSQESEKAKTSAPTISQSFQSILMKFGIVLRLLLVKLMLI